MVKIGPVVSADNRLIDGNALWFGDFVKYLRIYWTIFVKPFYHMKALYVPMMDLYLIFQFVKVRCHGNQIILP